MGNQDTNKYKNKRNFILLAITVLLVWYLGKYSRINMGNMQDYLAGFPRFYSGLVYISLYVIITFFVWFSKDIFWIVGAVLFGAAFSTFLVSIAESINAVILFYLARYLGRGYVQHSLKGRYSNLDERLGHLSFLWLFILRVTPLVPYRFMDLAAGLTRISFKKYIAAVVLGSPLKIFWIQLILSGVGKSILDDPYAAVDYFLKNSYLFIFSSIYFLMIIMVIIKLRRKN